MWMQNWVLRHFYKIHVSFPLICFVRFLASKLAKIQIWYKSFLLHKFNMGIKNAFDADCESIAKNHSSKKIICVTLLHILIKVKNSIFLSLFCNFFHIFGNFSTDSKSASNFAFLLPILDWRNTKCAHISTFCKLWSQNHKKRLIKTKNLYYKCVLEFNVTFTVVLLCSI